MNFETQMKTITTPEILHLIGETRRLVVLCQTRGHAKLIERLCADAKRSAVSNRWGFNLTRVLGMWSNASETEVGLVMVLTPIGQHGWHVYGDAVVVVGHKLDLESADVRQGAARVLIGKPGKSRFDPVEYAPAAYYDVEVAQLQPMVI